MESDFEPNRIDIGINISIHALRMESDSVKKTCCYSTFQQSIFANPYKCRLALLKKSPLERMFTSTSHRKPDSI